MLKIAKARRAIAMTTACLALAGGATIATSGNAQAFGGQSLRTLANGTCVDSGSSWDNGYYPAVYMHACNSGAFQHWVIINSSGGWQLQEQNYGWCLDSGVAMTMYPCNGGNYQKWTPLHVATVNGYAYYTLRNVAQPNLCLDAGQGKPMTFPCNQGNWQMFAWY